MSDGNGNTLQPISSDWWKNPGLYIGILTPVAAVLNQRFGIQLSPSELAILGTGLASTVLGLFGHGAIQSKTASDYQARLDAAAVISRGQQK